MKRTSTLFALCVGIFGMWLPLFAGNYYVSSSGTSGWEQAKNSDTPCDVATGFENAVAGDTVFFLSGTYTVPPREVGSWLSGYYNPSNSGTEGHPIVFMAYPGENPVFNGTSGGAADKDGHDYYHFATILGINDYTPDGSNRFKEYIVYDGFYLQADGGASEARVSLARGDNSYSGQRGRGIVIKNCTFNGGTDINPSHADGGTDDNREGLFISQLTGATVANCRFFDYRHAKDYHNTSAVKTYHSDHIVFEHCEVYNSSVGIFFKSNTDDSKIVSNYIHHCNTGIVAGAYGWWNDQNDHSKGYFTSETDRLEICHNLLAYQARIAISIENEDGACTDGMKICNNTIYSGNRKSVSISLGCGVEQEFYNNILYGLKTDGDIGLLRWSAKDNVPEREAAGIVVALGITAADHNQFGDFASNFLIRIRRPDSATVSYTSPGVWQASTELADQTSPGTGDLASDPGFTNASDSINAIEDFALADGSPCKGAGRNGVDMGADISLVGIRNDLPFSIRESFTGKKKLMHSGKLSPNYPNPFYSSTAIPFTVLKNGCYTLKIINCSGKNVAVVLNKGIPVGTYTVMWNGSDARGQRVAPGVYFYQLTAVDGYREAKTMLLGKR